MRYVIVIGIIFLSVVALAGLNMSSEVSVQQNDGASAISAAQNNLIHCYDAAKAAESSGANISQLTVRLNSAGLLLTRAEWASSIGNFGLVSSLAAQSQNELGSFVSDANSLQASAAQSRTYDFLLNVVWSILGTVAVVVGSFVVWRFFKRKFGLNGASDR